jgi:hypothetical protein
MNFEQAMMITKGNREAALWLVDYDRFCGLMDDIIDEPGTVTDARLVRETLALLADLCNPGWARDNAPRLYPLILAAANTWLDSNRLANSADARERMASDVLKSQYTEMNRVVAGMFGFEHMREVSAGRTFDFDLTPKEDK